jgi:CheY-like chemotaxis protein
MDSLSPTPIPTDELTSRIAPGVPGPRAHLLVVDDAMCIQKTLGVFLNRMRLGVEVAENGHVACQKAMRSLSKGSPYDIILMDIQMPQMNGRDAVRWLREHGWEGTILAVTAYADDDNCEEFMKLGCNGCIAKPITEMRLKEAISRHLASA